MIDSIVREIWNNQEESMADELTARPAMREDAAAITEICNHGIEDPIATFVTEPRSARATSRASGPNRRRW
jgi:L-amino acid N-acyltransferase YncA